MCAKYDVYTCVYIISLYLISFSYLCLNTIFTSNLTLYKLISEGLLVNLDADGLLCICDE